MNNKADKKARTSAIFNLVIGIIAILAAFNVLTGGRDVNLLMLLLGILFLGVGIWGIIPIKRS